MSLIVRSAVKRFAKEYAASKRRMSNGKPRFTRVSPEFLDHIEAATRNHIQARIDSMPSAGHTL